MAFDGFEEKGLTIIEGRDYASLMIQDTGVMETDLDDGMEDVSSIRDLPTAKLAAGGKTRWEVKNHVEEVMNEIRGVVLGRREVRVFFNKPLGQGGDAFPVCTSEDGKVGSPSPDGWQLGATSDCATCPKSQPFSRPTGGYSPACTLRQHIYVAVAGLKVPMVIDVPSASISNVSSYFGALKMHRRPNWSLETVFTVGTRTSKNNGVTYAVAELSEGDPVPTEMWDAMRDLSVHYRSVLIPPPVAVQTPPNGVRAGTGLTTIDGRVVDSGTGEILDEYEDLPFEESAAEAAFDAGKEA